MYKFSHFGCLVSKINRLPPEIYADNLKGYGVEADPRELMQRAMFACMQTRDELDALARIYAAQQGLESSNYRDIIRELKKHRVAGDQVLPVYKAHLAQLEDTIRKQNIVTFPKRPAVIRFQRRPAAARTIGAGGDDAVRAVAEIVNVASRQEHYVLDMRAPARPTPLCNFNQRRVVIQSATVVLRFISRRSLASGAQISNGLQKCSGGTS